MRRINETLTARKYPTNLFEVRMVGLGWSVRGSLEAAQTYVRSDEVYGAALLIMPKWFVLEYCLKMGHACTYVRMYVHTFIHTYIAVMWVDQRHTCSNS